MRIYILFIALDVQGKREGGRKRRERETTGTIMTIGANANRVLRSKYTG